jgi:hypothetical protein
MDAIDKNKIASENLAEHLASIGVMTNVDIKTEIISDTDTEQT